MSPAELMFGKTLRTRLDLLRPDLKQSVKSNQKKQVDNSTSRVRTISVGERVMVRDYLGENKWVPGIVKRKFGCLTYDVEVISGKLWRQRVNQIQSSLVPVSTSVEFQPTPELPVPELEAHQSVNPELQPESVIQPEQQPESTLASEHSVPEVPHWRYSLRVRKPTHYYRPS